MEKTYINCNLCGSDDYDVIIPEKKAQLHQIVKCKKCNLIYANPQTTIAIGGKVDLNTTVDVIEEISKEQIENFTPEKNQYLRKQNNQLKDQKSVLDYIEIRPKGTLLEIGAYAGNFCYEAQKRGWNIIGIEPQRLPSVYAKNNFNLEFINTPFENSEIKPESLSVIVSFHVIEHVYNPKIFISKAFELLEKNGLLILETPTYDSLSFKLLKHRERSVRCNGHIFFFTKDSLEKLVKSCGFKIVKHEYVGRTLTIGLILTNISIILSGRRNMFNSIIRIFRLEKLKLSINIKDMQRIYCEKI